MQATRDPSTRFCTSCQERVVDISRLTRTEAEAVLRRGDCVSAAYDEQGEIVFRPERRSLPMFPAAALRAAVVAAPLWLLGCHDDAPPTINVSEHSAPLQPQASGSSEPAHDEAECELEALEPAVGASTEPGQAVSVDGGAKPGTQRPRPHHRLMGKRPNF